MTHDILYLLNPSFLSETGVRQFCPDCMIVEGILATVPGVRQALEVRYVDFPRPRQAIVEAVGPEKQGCPLLVRETPDGLTVTEDMTEILTYLYRNHGVPAARGRVTL